MPNHVTNKIVFDAIEADRIFAKCCPDLKFDFRTLIPEPVQMYRGNTSQDDEQDFKCNWRSWHIENWGTKWNAYDCYCKIENGKAIIVFDTAWSVPYPVIAAFANTFIIPFEHSYFDEGHDFWGIEEWECKESFCSRKSKRRDIQDDYLSLCIDLKGYDPSAETMMVNNK